MKIMLAVLGVVLVVGLVRVIRQRQRHAAMAAGQELLMRFAHRLLQRQVGGSWRPSPVVGSVPDHSE